MQLEKSHAIETAGLTVGDQIIVNEHKLTVAVNPGISPDECILAELSRKKIHNVLIES